MPVGTKQVSRLPKNFNEWKAQKPLKPRSPILFTHSSLPILVIGAGPAGLAMMRELKDKKILFEGVERHSSVGGLWDQANPNSPAYDSLVTNSSKTTTHLGDPVKFEYPDFFSKGHALSYLNEFAKNHRLLENIQLNTQVLKTAKSTKGTWNVVFQKSDGQKFEKEYRALIVASGKNNKENAKIPKEYLDLLKGNQKISYFHSSSYRNPNQFKNQTILIIGTGNSGSEIATEVSQVARKTLMLVRTAPWVVPLRVLGRPADEYVQASPTWIPHSVNLFSFHILQRFYVGHPNELGFQTPDHDLLDRLPVSDRGFAEALRSGKILLHSSIEKIIDQKVFFKDSRKMPETVNTIIFATGYERKIPYLPPEYSGIDEKHFPFLIFEGQDPSIAYMNELAVAQGGWSIYARQAKALSAYFQAEVQNPKKADQFNLFRNLRNPNFKGPYFSKADHFHVDAKRYMKMLSDLTEWLL